jgi:hypothetical protein
VLNALAVVLCVVGIVIGQFSTKQYKAGGEDSPLWAILGLFTGTTVFVVGFLVLHVNWLQSLLGLVAVFTLGYSTNAVANKWRAKRIATKTAQS